MQKPSIMALKLVWTLLFTTGIGASDFLRQCEPIRIEMCRGIGYNETSMPNLVGHELQADVEFTLQTFAPLIEYVCSTQLKLFLCAAYVPMCTPKVPVPIGPCRNLCETVRSKCHPVLQGFGFPWPPALDCHRFYKENNHETMCMEGPGEVDEALEEDEFLNKLPTAKDPTRSSTLICPGPANSHLYVKIHRFNRCAPLCEANIIFGEHEKHVAEVWVATWVYATLGLALISTICHIISDDSKSNLKYLRLFTPLVWCYDMITIGWTIRFIAGRTASSCGFDPQIPNVSVLLIDGLSNVYCATTFLLRYYFGMAANSWWAILCLAWHRDVRRDCSLAQTHSDNIDIDAAIHGNKRRQTTTSKRNYEVTHSNLARFLAWGLPAFQTTAVIIARLVDADELLGSCFVGNQSDKGLQILVATPLFCYWIFGSMNLISGYLVQRRNRVMLQRVNTRNQQKAIQLKDGDIGTFLFIYCIPCTLQLIASIYQFANIDVWLNMSPYITAADGIGTPMWPFLTWVFMELLLGIICFAWVLSPKISQIHRIQLLHRSVKQPNVSNTQHQSQQSGKTFNVTENQSPPLHRYANCAISMNQISLTRSNYSSSRTYSSQYHYKPVQQFSRCSNETVL